MIQSNIKSFDDFRPFPFYLFKKKKHFEHKHDSLIFYSRISDLINDRREYYTT
jgi:hypothetical protein